MSFGTLLMVNEAVNQPNSLTPECKLDLEFRSVRQRLLYERCAVRVFYLANGMLVLTIVKLLVFNYVISCT